MGSTWTAIGALGLSLGLLSLSGCNVFDPRSDALACSLPTDCEAPRVCESGYCVVPAALLPDADPTAPDSDTTMIDSGPGLPDADPATCDTIALLDDFADGTAAPLWAEVPVAGVTISEASGVLTLAAPTLPAVTGSAGYASILNNYVLTESSFFVEVPTMVNGASNGEAQVRIIGDALNLLQIRFKRGTLSFTLTLDGTPTLLSSVTYNATAHRWWRILDSAGTFRVQTSVDGMQWIDQGNAATPAFFGSVGVELLLRAFAQGSPPGSLVFDNVNGGGVVPACP